MTGASEAAPRTSRALPGWIDAIALLVVVLLVRVPGFWTTLIDPDEDIFAMAAREVLNGHLPYIGFFDIKPVGSTLLVAGAFAALGKSFVALRLLGVACVWASALLLRRLTLDAGWSRPLALASALLYVGYAVTLHGLATMTELMLAPFTLGCMVLLLRMLRATGLGRRTLLAGAAGLMCSGAVLIKLVPVIPAGLVLGALLLWMIWSRRSSFLGTIAMGLAFSVMALLPMAATGLVYWLAGEFDAFYYANFGFTAAYTSSDIMAAPALRSVIRACTEIWPLLALAAVALVAAAIEWRTRPPPPLTLVAPLWLLGELAAVAITGHYYPHYFLMTLPPLSVLAVEGAVALHRRLGVTDLRAAVVLAVTAALIPTVPMWARTGPTMFGRPDVHKVAARTILEAAGGRKPTLLVTSQELTMLYLTTGADLPTPYAQPGQLLGFQTALTPIDVKAEVRRVIGARPEFIVLNKDIPLQPWVTAELDPVLAADYRELAHLRDFLILDVGVTRRHDIYIYQRRAPGP